MTNSNASWPSPAFEDPRFDWLHPVALFHQHSISRVMPKARCLNMADPHTVGQLRSRPLTHVEAPFCLTCILPMSRRFFWEVVECKD
ncbi:hypothetical protein LIA77_08043 [Sarocladium implicatum]|nr:hypothetical protein LIA77_08043 [Sarocladium implicatum]